MSTVPPTDGPGGRILSLARRLDEIAGVRDLEPLRVEAELLQRSAEQLESSGLALEPLLRRCMRLSRPSCLMFPCNFARAVSWLRVLPMPVANCTYVS